MPDIFLVIVPSRSTKNVVGSACNLVCFANLTGAVHPQGVGDAHLGGEGPRLLLDVRYGDSDEDHVLSLYSW